jgi:pimeloyl-ACP methyl ester carboxylesterase
VLAAWWLLVIVLLLLGAGFVLQSVVFERSAAAYPPPGALIDLGGRRLHLVCEGRGSPAVVLEAGGTHFSAEYRRVQRKLASKARVCAYDRAGMGWSDPGSAPRTARALSDDLQGVLASASIEPPYVLVASSAGGLTAELYSREHPESVAALVLLDALTGKMIRRHARSGGPLGAQRVPGARVQYRGSATPPGPARARAAH